MDLRSQVLARQKPDFFCDSDVAWSDYLDDDVALSSYQLDEACMLWGRYVDGQLYEATLEDEAKKIYFRNKAIREGVLRRLLSDDVGAWPLFRKKAGNVPFRQRAPLADDPDDPFGLYDKSEPPPPPKGRFKDPRDLWNRLGG